MPNFIDRLNEQLADKRKRDELRRTLAHNAMPHEEDLRNLLRKHWHTPLPVARKGKLYPAFAVDGSRAVRHLANGAYLFVAQALIMGEGKEASEVDVRILSGSTDAAVVERFAGLMMHRLEVSLACQFAKEMPSGSVVFMDGALYGQLTALYPLEEDTENPLPDYVRELPQIVIDLYTDLFSCCRKRDLTLISVAKTSHEVGHSEVWWRHEHGNQDIPRVISDSEMIYRWTNKSAGYTTPIIFGQKSFHRGTRRRLMESLRSAPTIVSFFLRLEEFDDALRIDVPAFCIGHEKTIGEVEDAYLIDVADIEPILELLAADYGGLEVYNALLYSVDREVRLRQEVMDEVYLSMIESSLREDHQDIELRLDRSERRFHSL